MMEYDDEPVYEGKSEHCPHTQWQLFGYWTPERIQEINALLLTEMRIPTPLFGKWKGGWEITGYSDTLYRARKQWWSGSALGGTFDEMLAGVQAYLEA